MRVGIGLGMKNKRGGKGEGGGGEDTLETGVRATRILQLRQVHVGVVASLFPPFWRFVEQSRN